MYVNCAQIKLILSSKAPPHSTSHLFTWQPTGT